MKLKSDNVFARLLAAENITVQYDPALRTAQFNTETRVLGMPIFGDVTKAVKNMFLSHEVGHALHTPRMAEVNPYRKDIEPSNNPQAQEKLQAYLNIVEDARIEKLIKRAYPGLRKDYYNAYQDIVKLGLLGDVSRVAEYSFMDRVNVHFKAGAFIDVPFSSAEQSIVDMIARAETFADVAAIVKLIYKPVGDDDQSGDDQSGDDQSGDDQSGDDQSGDDQSGDAGDKSESGDDQSGDDQSGDAGDKSESGDDQSESGDDQSGDAGDKSGDDQSGDAGDKSGDDQSGDAGDKSGDDSGMESAATGGDTGSNVDGDGKASRIDGGEVSTDKAIDKAMNRLHDTSISSITNYEIDYIDDPENYVVSTSDMESTYDAIINAINKSSNKSAHDTNYSAFNAFSKMIVSSMAQSFKRHQSAEEYRKVRTAKTGAIDTNKLHAYRLTEDIFRRSQAVPKGKNHGMVFFVDFSASMDDILFDTIKQTIMLARFCKSIRVPFDVYGFTSGGVRINVSGSPIASERTYITHLMSSNQGAASFAKACEAIYTHAREIKYDSRCNINIPYDKIRMSGTTIAATMFVALSLVRDFKRKNRIDLITAVCLTDGDDGVRVHRLDGTHTNVSSKITGRVYTGIPYGNVIMQEIAAAHNAHVINMHITDHSSLPMASDNETGKSINVGDLAHNSRKITEVKNVGGFTTAYMIGKKMIDSNKESKTFMKMIAKDFATHKN